MTTKFDTDEYIFKFTLENDTLRINVESVMPYEKYETLIGCELLKNHKIISSADVLHKALCAGFNKDEHQTSISYDTQKNNASENDKTFHIRVTIALEYIFDQIDIYLPLVKQNVVKEQKIDPIDEKIHDMSKQFDCKLQTLESHLIDNSYSEQTKILETFKKMNDKIMEMQEHINNLENALAQSTKTIVNYKHAFDEIANDVPVFISFGEDDFGRHGHLIRNVNLIMRHSDRIYIERDYFRYNDTIINFSLDKFKYFNNLKYITFSECTFKNLDFLNVTDTLTEIKLENMTELISVGKLAEFKNLKFIMIKGHNKIQDIEKLVDCKNLKELIVSEWTSIEKIPKDVHFKIIVDE